jgi:hypothetical protein
MCIVHSPLRVATTPYTNRYTQLPYSETGIKLKNKRSERSTFVKIRRKF